MTAQTRGNQVVVTPHVPQWFHTYRSEMTNDAWTQAISSYGAWLAAAGRARTTIRLRSYHLDRLARVTNDPWTVTGDEAAVFLAEPSWSAEYRRSTRSSLHGFYEWAVRTRRIESSPMEGLPTVQVPRGVPRPTPSARFHRAMTMGSDRDRLMVLLAAYAGLRRAEIAAVHADDLLDDGQSLRVEGKGGRVRVVPLHPELAAAIDAELGLRRGGCSGTGYRYGRPEPDGWLFPGRDGHLSADAVGKVLSGLLGEGWTGHTLRHRFASRAYASQRDIRAVQELLGHSSVVTTQRYTQVPDGALRSAVLAAA